MSLPLWLIFALIASAYAFAAWRNHARRGGQLSPAARIWLGVALLFGVAALVLFIRE